MFAFHISRKIALLILLTIGLTTTGWFVFSFAFHASSSTASCITCHEMRVVAEQGWMKSPHYQNAYGVVAECADCHIEPEISSMVWTKVRDGSRDIWVHTFGQSDPVQMDWDELAELARFHSKDSACKRCHNNLTPQGGSIKMIIAHREYLRFQGGKKCVECHRSGFHDRFRQYLQNDVEVTAMNGRKK